MCIISKTCKKVTLNLQQICIYLKGTDGIFRNRYVYTNSQDYEKCPGYIFIYQSPYSGYIYVQCVLNYKSLQKLEIVRNCTLLLQRELKLINISNFKEFEKLFTNY